MNWKDCGRKQSWPNLRYCLNIFLGRLGNTTNRLNHDYILIKIWTSHRWLNYLAWCVSLLINTISAGNTVTSVSSSTILNCKCGHNLYHTHNLASATVKNLLLKITGIRNIALHVHLTDRLPEFLTHPYYSQYKRITIWIISESNASRMWNLKPYKFTFDRFTK